MGRTTSVVIACLSLLLAWSISDRARGELRWGVTGGVNMGYMAYDDFNDVWWWDDQVWAPGFRGGLAVDYAFNGIHSLQTGLVFKRLRNRVDLEGWPDSAGHFTLSLDYLCLPASWKFRFGEASPVYAAIGADLGYLISAESYTELDDRSVRGYEEDILDHLERWNAAADVGVGVEFTLGHTNAFVAAEYAHGLVSVDRAGHWITGWKTREFGLLLGVFF